MVPLGPRVRLANFFIIKRRAQERSFRQFINWQCDTGTATSTSDETRPMASVVRLTLEGQPPAGSSAAAEALSQRGKNRARSGYFSNPVWLSTAFFEVRSIRAHLITTTERCGETERGCVRSTSRSGSAGGVRVEIISPSLGVRARC